jgi:hypothetical protein
MTSSAESTPKRAFVSYSHDSDEHCTRVLVLSDRLCRDGIDCALDQYLEQGPPEGWPKWMALELEIADYVIVVCSRGYCDKASARDGAPISGLGVRFESLLMYQDFVDSGSISRKIVPVLLRSVAGKDLIHPGVIRLGVGANNEELEPRRR